MNRVPQDMNDPEHENDGSVQFSFEGEAELGQKRQRLDSLSHASSLASSQCVTDTVFDLNAQHPVTVGNGHSDAASAFSPRA